MGNRTRTAAAVGGAVLFLAGVAAGVVAWRSAQPGPAAFRVSLQSVPAADSSDWSTAATTCPSSGRGSGPIGADDAPVRGAAGARGQQLGAGQFVAYHLRIDADPLAPPRADLAADLAFRSNNEVSPVDLAKGVLCAFVDESDPLTTSPDASAAVRSSQPDEQGRGLTATVDLRNLQAGTSAVVEIWLEAGAVLPRSTAVFQATVVDVLSPARSRARIIVPEARLVTSSQQSRDIELELEGPDTTDLQPGQEVQLTMRIRNASEADVGRDVVARLVPDPTLVVTTVAARDDAGAPTTCDQTSGVVTCTSPYLVPDERVTVDVRAIITADAPRVFRGSGATCEPQAQDVCVKAELATTGAAAGPAQGAELALDLPAPDFVSATKVAADGSPGLYVGRVADFLYVLAAGTDTPLQTVEVTDPACSPLTLVSGDEGADTILAPGERWTYRCSAVVDSSQLADVTVTATTTTGQPALAVTRLATPVLDPAIGVSPVTGNDLAVEVVNSGDAALTGVVLDGRTCEVDPEQGDADEDGVLDPGERWIFACRARSGAVRAYGTDPAGGAVTAAIGS